jgi:hypothetical protein
MKLVLLILISLGLIGCAENLDVMHQSDLNLESEVTLIAPVAQPIVKNPDGTYCYGPQPDGAINISRSVTGINGGTVTGGDDEAYLGGRNPNVLISRDLLFQSCLAEARLKLSNEERKALFSRTLDIIQAINSESLDGEAIESDTAAAD